MKVVLETERYTILEENGQFYYRLNGRQDLSRPYTNQEDAELDAWDAYSFQASNESGSEDDDWDLDDYDEDDDDD